MICCTSRVEPLALVLHPAGEPATASGSSAASSTASASRVERADRRLELVADVGDEVAADGVDPARLGAVLDQHQHEPAAQRRHPGGDLQRRDRGPRGSTELGLADLAVPAHLADQLEQLGDGRPVAADQPEAYAGGLALSTSSSASTTTADERSTASTAATPARHRRLVGGGGRGRWSRSLIRQARTTTAPSTSAEHADEQRQASSRPRARSYAAAIDRPVVRSRRRR